MKALSSYRQCMLWLLVVPVMTGVLMAKDANDSSSRAVGGEARVREGVGNRLRALPSAGLPGGAQLNYVGVYPADGKFRPPSKLDKFRSEKPWWTRAAETQEMRPVEVPLTIQLRSIERVIEDYEPPARAVSAVRQHSAWRAGGHSLVRFVYGPENVLQAPTYLTTDSRGRLIITDSAVPAVHVLDVAGEDSFRIMGGTDRRLRRPGGAAIDAQDNIYVTDSARGIVFMYGPDGNFIRRIGDLEGGETLFHAPTAIAIDRVAGHMYVLDRSRVVMLDLNGNVLKRAGKLRAAGTPEFDNPSNLALAEDGIIVLDANGSRIQVMDLELNLRRKATIPPMTTPNASQRPALSVDSSGYIYVTWPSRSIVRVFKQDGTLIGDFGTGGSDIAQFNVPAGIWVDPQNRIYVADKNNRRVQVFQIDYMADREGKTPEARGR